MSAQLSLVPALQPRSPSLGARLLVAALSRTVVLLRIAPPRHTPGEHPLDHLALPAPRQAEIRQLSVASPG